MILLMNTILLPTMHKMLVKAKMKMAGEIIERWVKKLKIVKGAGMLRFLAKRWRRKASRRALYSYIKNTRPYS